MVTRVTPGWHGAGRGIFSPFITESIMAKYIVTVRQTVVEQCEVEIEADSVDEAYTMDTDQFADDFVAALDFVNIIDRRITHVEPVTKPVTKHACSCGESDCVWCG
jgi:hypothetical protein